MMNRFLGIRLSENACISRALGHHGNSLTSSSHSLLAHRTNNLSSLKSASSGAEDRTHDMSSDERNDKHNGNKKAIGMLDNNNSIKRV